MRHALRRHGDAVLLLAVVIAIAALHVLAFGNRLVSDDAWFAQALDGTSLRDFLAFRYQQWSGRVPIEGALVWMVSHPWAWKLADALAWLLFCHSAGRIAFAGTAVGPARATVLAFTALMLLSPEVVFTAAWWITGSVNYLWPVALGLYGTRAFVEPGVPSPAVRLSMVLASGLAMYNEQVAIALLPAAALLAWARRGRAGATPGWDLAHLAFMAANAFVLFAAPGSRNRFLSEQALRFPDFDALGPLHNVAIGAGLVFDGVLDPANLLLLFLLAMVAALVWSSPAGRGAKAVILAMLAFLALDYLRLVPGFGASAALQRVYEVPAPDGATASSGRAYALPAVAMFAVACLVGGAVLAAWRSRRDAIAVAVTLLLGLLSLAALGFSPTAYASGWRIHFVCQVAFLLVALRLAWHCRIAFGTRACGAFAAVAGVVAAWRVVALMQGA